VSATTASPDTRSTTGCSPKGSAGKFFRIVLIPHDANDFPSHRKPSIYGFRINVGDWNDAVLVASGNHITYSINGHIMTDLVDNSPAALLAGRLALQLHQGFTMDIRFKDLKIKLLD